MATNSSRPYLLKGFNKKKKKGSDYYKIFSFIVKLTTIKVVLGIMTIKLTS